MATQYDPIAKDESLNTTEATPRNIADVLAEGLKGIEDAIPTYTEGDGIDITNREISVDTTFTEASTRANIASGESFATILGKIKKFFTDLKTVAFTGAYSDLIGTPDLSNVAYKNINNNFSADQTIDTASGTTSTLGVSYLNVGNSIAEGTNGNSFGVLRIYGKGTKRANFLAQNVTTNRDIQAPDASGTLALKDVNNYFTENQTIDRASGTTTTPGSTTLEIGNATPAGTDGNSYGRIRIYSQSQYYGMLQPTALTANRTLVIPDKGGTLATIGDCQGMIVTSTDTKTTSGGGFISSLSGTNAISISAVDNTGGYSVLALMRTTGTGKVYGRFFDDTLNPIADDHSVTITVTYLVPPS